MKLLAVAAGSMLHSRENARILSSQKEFKMSLGVCCQWLEPRTKRDGSIVLENSVDEQGLQMGCFNKGKYTNEKIILVYRNNVEEIIKLIPKLVSSKIQCFRLSSGLLPLFEFNETLAKNDLILSEKLQKAGRLFTEAKIRVTTHPGQFVVISSDSDDVILNSIKDLKYHAWIFDMMGFEATPYNAINIHGGKAERTEKLIKTIDKLPLNVRNRLTLENDEMSYGILDLLVVSKKTNVPVVWDSHHHSFNDNKISQEEGFFLGCESWKKLCVKPLQHLSNSRPECMQGNIMQRRKHSDYISTIPRCQLDALAADSVDVEIEAKMKNLAVEKIKKDFFLV